MKKLVVAVLLMASVSCFADEKYSAVISNIPPEIKDHDDGQDLARHVPARP